MACVLTLPILFSDIYIEDQIPGKDESKNSFVPLSSLIEDQIPGKEESKNLHVRSYTTLILYTSSLHLAKAITWRNKDFSKHMSVGGRSVITHT